MIKMVTKDVKKRRPAPAREVITMFGEAWKKRSGKDWDGMSYPFTHQDNWDGVSVLEFAMYVLKAARK